MNILLIAGDLPAPGHTVRAVNRVLWSCVEKLRVSHQVFLQPILRSADDLPSSSAESLGAGVTLLPPLARADYFPGSWARQPVSRARRALDRLLRNRRYFYPAVSLLPQIEERARRCGADVCLIFWSSEGIAATYGLRSCPKVAYYGVPDYVARGAQLDDPALFGLPLSPAKVEAERETLRRKEEFHLEMMRDCATVAVLSADHAAYYAEHGHPRSLYVQNMWPAAPEESAPTPPSQPSSVVKIIGNVGRPASTGNTYGLLYIGKELLPRLDRAFGRDGYELHLLGHGEPFPAVRAVLNHPSVRMRGFVEDIDAEIRSSHVFLVANNAYPSCRGSHTRFLHAWSLKACCVGHAYNVHANPEMVDGENVLLGETPDEMVSAIVRATRDVDLRRRIGEGGYRTYRMFFTPEAVMARLEAEIQHAVRPHP